MGFIVSFAAGHFKAFDADTAWFEIDPNTIVLTVFDGSQSFHFPPERWVSVDDDSPETTYWNERLSHLTMDGWWPTPAHLRAAPQNTRVEEQ